MMKKTTKKNISKEKQNSEWILLHEQFNGDEIFIKVSHVEAVERLRSSYDGRPAGSTAYHKEICKVHTYGGKTFGVKESYKYVMDTIDFLSHLS